MNRPTSTTRDVKAGCETCAPGRALWFGGQAQGTAAQHYDKTGHTTWCEVYAHISYGGTAKKTPPAVSPAAAAAFVGLPPKVR